MFMQKSTRYRTSINIWCTNLLVEHTCSISLSCPPTCIRAVQQWFPHDWLVETISPIYRTAQHWPDQQISQQLYIGPQLLDVFRFIVIPGYYQMIHMSFANLNLCLSLRAPRIDPRPLYTSICCYHFFRWDLSSIHSYCYTWRMLWRTGFAIYLEFPEPSLVFNPKIKIVALIVWPRLPRRIITLLS